jgi:hypothetical protein
MQDFPISTHATEDGTFVIRQPLTLGDPQDYIQIEMSEEQLKRLGKEIDLLFAKKAAKRINEAVETASAEHFEEFWQLYPSARRVDKSGCKRRWIQRNLDTMSETIINHVRQAAASQDWTKDQGKYVPLITTYMNQSRWEAGADDSRATFTLPSV